MNPSSRQLAFHAAIVLLFGLLIGAAYAAAIKRNAAATIVNAWRVAHVSLSMGAMLMLAVAALLPALQVAAAVQWLIAGSLIVSAYAFCVSKTLGALTGERGLASGPAGALDLVYVGNLLGVAGSVVAAGAFLFATFVSL